MTKPHRAETDSPPSLPTLLVFIKAPIPGFAKTRLAAELGNEQAAQWYDTWTRDWFIRSEALAGRVRRVAYFAQPQTCWTSGTTPRDGPPEANPGDPFAHLRSLVDVWWPQPDGDLGERLAAGFAQAFAEGASSVIAIGTDCPELTTTHIEQAIDQLMRVPVVFGPAADGGYYLIGLARPLPELFRDIPWSSSATLAAELAACRRLGLEYALLEPLADIDTHADFLAWQARNAAFAPNGGMPPG